MAIYRTRSNEGLAPSSRWVPESGYPWNAYLYSGCVTAPEEDVCGCWTPNADVYEDEQAFIMTMDLPGFTREDVKIELENDILSICGDRKFDEQKRGSYHRLEREYGDFCRSFSVGNRVDQAKIEATMDKGVLTVRLPKAEASKPKQIEVKVK